MKIKPAEYFFITCLPLIKKKIAREKVILEYLIVSIFRLFINGVIRNLKAASLLF